MAYRPSDHIPTERHVLAAWLVCLGIAASGLGVPALWHEATSVIHHAQAQAAAQRLSSGQRPIPLRRA
jgi:hypothetical protein